MFGSRDWQVLELRDYNEVSHVSTRSSTLEHVVHTGEIDVLEERLLLRF